jgi:putative spermidine/putrescine transport system permease protein
LNRWIGVVPFLLFTLLFLILPTMNIVMGAFRTPDGTATLANIKGLFTPSIMASYWISIKISLASAFFGCLIGFGIAAAVTLGGLPKSIRGPLMTFSGVASNFAGVPLAFAFLATLGRLGLVTMLLKSWFGINIYAMGFNLLSFWGLTLTYLFFQIPLMVLIITPALDGLKRDWREAASVLGATGPQYWRMVALPILMPSLLGTFALLFANAFGAVATAYALTGSSLSIVPIVLFAQIRGDVLGDPHLGYALAFGMIVITGIANALYIWLRMRAERWMQ